MTQFVRKTLLGGFAEVSGGQNDPECSHVLMDREEYDRMLRYISEKEWAVTQARNEGDNALAMANRSAREALAQAEKEALRQGDFDRFLTLVRESGRSSAMYLQNIIPTGSVTAQELMVTIALCERILEGRGAVRVHGGGFGGTAQAFVPLDMLEKFKAATEAALGPGCCHVVMIRPAGGIKLG